MYNKMSTFAKGLGTGALIGMAICAGGSMMMNSNNFSRKTRVMKKRLSHAARSAGDIMCNVSSMLK